MKHLKITSHKRYMYTLIYALLLLPSLKVNAMAINAKDAEVSVSKNTLILKHVHSATHDYTFNLRWNAKTNTWETQSYVIDTGYGWRSEERLPHSFNSAASVVSGNKLYIVNTMNIDIYDTRNKTWEYNDIDEINDNPFNQVRAALVAGNIYIFKLKTDHFLTDTSTPEVWKYNLADSSISKLNIPFIPDLRDSSQAVVYNNKIYFFGGYFEVGAALQNQQSTIWLFDPSKLAFSKKADMPDSHFNAAATVLNDKIYIFGGRYYMSNDFHGGARSYGISIYNPKADKWEVWNAYNAQLSMSHHSPEDLSWVSANPLKGKIIATTGSATCIFDPVSKKVSYQTPMPLLHGYRMTGAVVADKLYIAGGSDEPRRLDSFKPNLATLP